MLSRRQAWRRVRLKRPRETSGAALASPDLSPEVETPWVPGHDNKRSLPKSSSWPEVVSPPRGRARKLSDPVLQSCEKTVSFNDIDMHVLIPPRDEYDEQMKQRLWWRSRDIAAFALNELRRRNGEYAVEELELMAIEQEEAEMGTAYATKKVPSLSFASSESGSTVSEASNYDDSFGEESPSPHRDA